MISALAARLLNDNLHTPRAFQMMLGVVARTSIDGLNVRLRVRLRLRSCLRLCLRLRFCVFVASMSLFDISLCLSILCCLAQSLRLCP